MDRPGIIEEDVNCPQCGYPAIQERYYVTGETRCTCNWCGYGHVQSLEDGNLVYKGCGSIHRGNSIELLRTPLSIVQRDDILATLKPEDKFYVWNGSGLESLQGAMPMTLEDIYELQAQEAEYYKEQFSFRHLPDDVCIPFDTED